ncbi:hypothetical protein BCR43DRAFT_483095 [Syncephalastrum racemosum]|uniref:FAD dependent oxidoreductase domain-containing protein n=1 Tax=Syncephalastrum racemosum TaxID=13706 RepID=A0A1X2HUN8_SYNRA|nr:hypothetical protein BCR43DRAFT_483095 [Syncephalastrum racemosum]
MEIAKTRGKEAGVMAIPSEDYYDELVPDYTDPWFRKVVDNFEFVGSAELPPTAKIGHRYTTVVINTPHYLQWLMHQFLSNGGQVKRQSLTCLQEGIPSDADAVVHCTGLGARYLVNDTNVFPTRGQTVIIRAPHIKKTVTLMTKNQSTYYIPRSDGTVVCGGTKEKNDFNPNPEKAIATRILQRTQALCPEMAGCEIVRHAVGLRPSRVGGPRIENETIVKPNGEPIIVTHSYGHGGFGVQSSWGAAEFTVALVEKGIAKSKL